jgi:hypothetical protein
MFCLAAQAGRSLLGEMPAAKASKESGILARPAPTAIQARKLIKNQKAAADTSCAHEPPT